MTLITTEEELDLAMREADVAIRLRQPTQPDLIQRKLFQVHFHAYASPEYLKRFGTPRTPEDLDAHRLLVLGGAIADLPAALALVLLGGTQRPRAARAVARHQQHPRHSARLSARHRHRDAARLHRRGERRRGAAFSDVEGFAYDAYLVYPEEMKSVARIQVFRDFLVAKAQRWHF